MYLSGGQAQRSALLGAPRFLCLTRGTHVLRSRNSDVSQNDGPVLSPDPGERRNGKGVLEFGLTRSFAASHPIRIVDPKRERRAASSARL